MTTQTKTPHPIQRALSNRYFRFLWIGSSISVLGSQFSLIALSWLILQQMDDPQDLGLVLASLGLAPLSQAIAGALSKWILTALQVLVGGLMVFLAGWLALHSGLKILCQEMINTTASD